MLTVGVKFAPDAFGQGVRLRGFGLRNDEKGLFLIQFTGEYGESGSVGER